jgi:Flp pilus assembly pilin Flp
MPMPTCQVSNSLFAVRRSLREALSRHRRRFAVEESGATAVEYGLIAARISLATIIVVFAFGEDIEACYQAIDTHHVALLTSARARRAGLSPSHTGDRNQRRCRIGRRPLHAWFLLR